MKRLILILIFLSLFFLSAQSDIPQNEPVEVFVANLSIATQVGFAMPDRISPLVKLMLIEKADGVVRYRNLVDASYNDWVVKSFEDVKKVAALNDVEYLLFGDLFIRDDSLEAHVYLYGRSDDKVVFEATHELNSINENLFAKELADKISAGLEERFRILLEEEKKNIFFPDYIGVYNGFGYFVPMAEQWALETGILAVETGLSFVRLAVYRNDTVGILLRPYVRVGYALGVSKPGLTETYWNTLQVMGGLALNVELFERFGILVGAGVHGRFDFSSVERFGAWVTYSSQAFGLDASIGLEYWFGRRRLFGLGLDNAFGFNFYAAVLLEYRLSLYTIFRFRAWGE